MKAEATAAPASVMSFMDLSSRVAPWLSALGSDITIASNLFRRKCHFAFEFIQRGYRRSFGGDRQMGLMQDHAFERIKISAPGRERERATRRLVPAVPARADSGQIGRASCRERV